MGKYYLGLDQGTTGTTALLLNEHWEVVSQGYYLHSQIYPEPGLVEQDPEQLWEAACASVDNALEIARVRRTEIACIRI